jgi:hypothetical protein
MLIELFDCAISNKVQFQYVLYDSWFASNDTLKHIVSKEKHVITEIKTNRLIVLNEIDRNRSNFKNLDKLNLETNIVYYVYLKDYNSKVALIKQIFTNKDDSI